MNKRASLVYNLTGQTVEFYPPEWADGVPSAAATYKVWQGSESMDNTPEFTGTATADSVDTTFDAASGFSETNRRTANLAATTSITVGAFYRAANAISQAELLEVGAITSTVSVTVRHEMKRDYASADTFKGLRQTLTIDPTFIALEEKINATNDPWKIEWSYTINSVARKHMTFFDVVRVAKQHNVVAEDLYDLRADLEFTEPTSQRGEAWEPQIEAGFVMVTDHLRDYKITVSQVRDAERLDNLVKHAAMLIIAEDGNAPDGRDTQVYVEERQAKYQARLENVRNDFHRDTGSDGAITPGAETQFWFKR